MELYLCPIDGAGRLEDKSEVDHNVTGGPSVMSSVLDRSKIAFD